MRRSIFVARGSANGFGRHYGRPTRSAKLETENLRVPRPPGAETGRGKTARERSMAAKAATSGKSSASAKSRTGSRQKSGQAKTSSGASVADQMHSATARKHPTHFDTPPPAKLTTEEELKAYRNMLLIRRFEEKAGQLYGMGFIGGFCHLYIGQEAVVTGMQMAIERRRPDHHRLSRPRPHAGVRHGPGRRHGRTDRAPGRLFQGQGRLHAHVLARRRTSSAAMASSAPRCRSAPGLPSPTTTAATTGCRVTFFGDGAANQGQVYESFNMAELWKLPVIYVIENNRYAMGTSVARSSAQTDFSQRGASFNIPGMQVDGMDVRAVKAAGDRRSNGAARARGRSSSRCRPIAIAAIPCPTRRNTARKRRGPEDARRARPDRAGHATV